MANPAGTKKIAKNTIALSLRMILTMGINIYASRVIMQNLGVVDFGIYNVVGGVVAMFSVLTVSLVTGTQRYLNYYIGKGKLDDINKVFSTSINIFFIFAFAIVIFGETIGFYFLNYKLNIPNERFFAANCVLQFTLLGTFLKLVSSPFDALIVSQEKMTTFAYVAVFDSIFRCVAAISLPYFPTDRLITYSLLLFLLYASMRIFYSWYCKRNFPTIIYIWGWNKDLFKEMFSFSGWTLLGCFTFMTYTQGMTFLINLFFGPVVNAAQALAYQVNAAISGFRGSFIMATKPQIVKSYAEGNLHKMHKLIFFSSKLAYFIMALLSIPLILRTDYVLGLWLHEVPDYTAIFLKILLITTIWSSLSEISVTAVQATGKIRNYQISESICLLCILPVSYILYKFGASPESCYVTMFVFFFLAQFIRLYFMHHQIGINVHSYLINIILRMIICVFIAFYIALLADKRLPESFMGLLFISVISAIITIISFYFIGLVREERSAVKRLVYSKIIKNHSK